MSRHNNSAQHILIAAGGTGGHVYPALAIAEAVREHYPNVSLAFVGSVGGFERPLVQESGVVFESYNEVRAGPLHGVGLPRKLWSAVNLAVGTLQALALMLRQRPDAILLTGGWSGLPVSLAGWLLRVPILIFLPDIEPGLTIQALKPFARRVAVTTAESQPYVPAGKMIVTGYPLRAALRRATRDQAVQHFGLDPARQTLLVFGGSRGARAINNALLDIAPDLLADGIQIIHVTGTLDWPDIERRAAGLSDRYHAFPYLHGDMGLAFAAADLVVSRAGASVLGELPYFGLASILIPYPHAWRYQKVNADWLASRGAAVRLDEDRMAADLLPTIRSLLNDPARLAEMRAKAAALAQPDGARRIAAELVQLAGGQA
ncbi:MAG: UDP-N-acetylglucosamine--N-acetylmuramyl-(pentapeptide) pyrophosphoryl-undecaprenol N-acetylglucosamine transferase [Chloroflexi bacterium]|nr:UDP-N-acetylglucosamine--N-acetylmuramyl-(pentapeptide) pyrophosphoryl-undecaprenol N-acetylglucosamine transferase [Chloroflexota bacterium]